MACKPLPTSKLIRYASGSVNNRVGPRAACVGQNRCPGRNGVDAALGQRAARGPSTRVPLRVQPVAHQKA
jgi:hypothetical protein